MDNSFFIFSDHLETPVEIQRAHICTWEFNNNSTLIEFGFEVSNKSLPSNKLSLSLFIPWLSQSKPADDLYDNLSQIENGRFIFNDSIKNVQPLDGSTNKLGVVYDFINREHLCILPVSITRTVDNILELSIDLQSYRSSHLNCNAYFRFSITPSRSTISMQKRGISKSTIVYDIKVNERRNIPDKMVSFFAQKSFCKIETCFCLFIIPNRYDIVFFENDSLKSVRTLEYEAFTRYLGDRRVKKDELIVIFNKKKGLESFSFFSIFTKERVGPGQYFLAILINMISGILLFLPSFRKSLDCKTSIWKQLPIELIIAFLIMVGTLVYFLWPKLNVSKWVKQVIHFKRK